MITGKNISFSYENEPVLKDISFQIEECDFVAVLGPNGGGKTTLAKLIVGLLPLQHGSISISGIPVRNVRNRGMIGYVPQKHNIERLFPGTVREIFSSQSSKGKSGAAPMPELGIEPFLDLKFTDLSGGQQQRVLIAVALQNNPRILILDEPTVGVDMKTEHEFLSMLKSLNKEKHITILWITHDVGMVPNLANKVLCINHNICCEGLSSESKELLQCVYDSHKEHHHH